MIALEGLYLLFTVALALAGLALVWAAVRAYAATERTDMIHLSLGFTLIVAATVSTAIGALLNDFQHVRTLLLVHNSFSVGGYLFVLYSVVAR